MNDEPWLRRAKPIHFQFKCHCEIVDNFSFEISHTHLLNARNAGAMVCQLFSANWFFCALSRWTMATERWQKWIPLQQTLIAFSFNSGPLTIQYSAPFIFRMPNAAIRCTSTKYIHFIDTLSLILLQLIYDFPHINWLALGDSLQSALGMRLRTSIRNKTLTHRPKSVIQNEYLLAITFGHRSHAVAHTASNRI